MTGARAAPKPLLFDCSQKGGRHKYGPCTAQPGPHPTYSQLPWPEILHKSEFQKMCYFSLMSCCTSTQWGESANYKEVVYRRFGQSKTLGVGAK